MKVIKTLEQLQQENEVLKKRLARKNKDIKRQNTRMLQLEQSEVDRHVLYLELAIYKKLTSHLEKHKYKVFYKLTFVKNNDTVYQEEVMAFNVRYIHCHLALQCSTRTKSVYEVYHTDIQKIEKIW